MPEGVGYRFQPGAMETPLQRGGNGGPASTVPQEAIRTLSLRVPQTQSVPGIAPLPLLNATGGGGGDLDMLLAALLKAFGPQAMRGGGGGRGQQSMTGGPPRITPGWDDEPIGGPVDLTSLIPGGRMEELARRTGGNTGFGTTGRGTMGPPTPLPEGIQPLF